MREIQSPQPATVSPPAPFRLAAMDSESDTFAGDEAGFVLRDRHHPAKRAGFAVFGLFAIVAPLWDFWPAFRAPSGLSLFFLAILLGAWAVGFALLAGALFGDATELRLRGGRLTLTRSNAFRTRTEILVPGDVAGIGVTEHDWEGRPKTYSVELVLGSGRKVGSNDYDTRETVDGIVARIGAALAAADG